MSAIMPNTVIPNPTIISKEAAIADGTYGATTPARMK